MSFQAFLADNGLGSGLQVESKEVFSIVSDVNPSVSWALPTSEMFEPMQIVLGAVVSRAPWLVLVQLVGEMWAVVALILNLTCGHTGLRILGLQVEEAVVSGELSEENLHTLLLLAYTLISVNTPMLILQNFREDVARRISGHIRAHFYPVIAKDFLSRIFQTITAYLAIVCAFATLSSIAMLTKGRDQWLLLSVLLQFPWVIFNVIQSTGSNILTDDPSFLRLCGLHKIVFDGKYAFNLLKDGVRAMTVAEYTQASHAVGPVSFSYSSLSFYSPINYLQFGVDLLVSYWPLMILLTPLREMFRFRLSTIFFSLYAVCIIRPFFKSASLAFINGVLTENLMNARNLVSSATPGQVLLSSSSISGDGIPFDSDNYLATKKEDHYSFDLSAAKNPSLKDRFRGAVYPGMKLGYNKVTVEGTSREVVVQNASFEIKSGMLVLVVGAKGSGKTALVESLLGLPAPASGEILVDDMPIAFSNPQLIQLHRNRITFLTQHREQIYPLSAKENIFWGHNGVHHSPIAEIAGNAAGCSSLLQTNGTVGVPYSIYQSFGKGLIGSKTSAAMEIVRPVLEKRFSVQLTPVQEQRLLAARMLYRLYQGYTRLLVLDEPVNMLTTDEEREVLDQFLAAREGITTIVVSKRFKELALKADMILCMDNGRIVQRGSHAELIRNEQGTYARLYATL
ncbi:hypothetical protein H0H92_006359 [Tricholoma furcatifolium]|nr:hypothetical protein H0H92_006359 [Tricholoma furcatifolium]